MTETPQETLPNIDRRILKPAPSAGLGAGQDDGPKILLLYGSLRAQSYSRKMTQQAVRVLNYLGATTEIFDPTGLPLPDGDKPDHPKGAELRELAA